MFNFKKQKFRIKWVLFSCIWMLLSSVYAASITVQLENLRIAEEGMPKMVCTLISSGHDSFMSYGRDALEDMIEKNSVVHVSCFRPEVERYSFQIDGIEAGYYAVRSFQDINNNGKLDQLFLGIPYDRYAVSGKRKKNLGVPMFYKAKSYVEDDENKLFVLNF